MKLDKRDREFRLPKISYLEFKQVEMDRVLIGLLARLKHNGYSSRLRRHVDLGISQFVQEFLECPEFFSGFSEYPDVTERWTETHLLDLVSRGTANQKVASPRPLHGYTYLFRNARYCRDYGAAQHIYETLYSAKDGASALEHLKHFFFAGTNFVTGQPDSGVPVDVETQALLHLSRPLIQDDLPNTSIKREIYAPLLPNAADCMAEDMLRILAYQSFIPRTVMVDYVKVLMAFHTSLYHLRLFRALPDMLKRHGTSQYDLDQLDILVDVAGTQGTAMASLAERSADMHYRRISPFVQAHLAIKKLDQFATHLSRFPGKLPTAEKGYHGVDELLQLLEPQYKEELNPYCRERLAAILGSTGQDELAPSIQAILDLELSPFETYVEILSALRGPYFRKYITQTMDALLLKNSSGALLAQAGSNGNRRFVLDAHLLEVLLQIAVLQTGGKHGFHTEPLPIDDVLTWLRTRYGIHIDRLPEGNAWHEAGIDDLKALRENSGAFRNRLREIGFYRDLSDAYITQTVTPRYEIAEG
jgi:hypothetical protein